MRKGATVKEYLPDEVRIELRRAESKHAPMHSAHEGFAVILEELEELKAEVFKKRPDVKRMRKEALQIAAMGLRFIQDVCDREGATDHVE